MNSAASSPGADAPRHRKRLQRAIKEALRELGAQLSALNHSVGARIEVKASDLECLDLISQHGPLSPSDLARRSGQHPATMTGILDRLERGGWIERVRDQSDRRGVLVSAARGRASQVLRLYLVDSGMNAALDGILAGYQDRDLELLADFLRRTAQAGRAAADKLTQG
jgi:DNA-binding MarR family transcriptional regulator